MIKQLKERCTVGTLPPPAARATMLAEALDQTIEILETYNECRIFASTLGFDDQAATISSACGTSGIAHRFKVSIEAYLAAHHGRPIYVLGLRPNLSGQNATLSNSGSVTIPELPRDMSSMVNIARGKPVTSAISGAAGYAFTPAYLTDGSLANVAYPANTSLDYSVQLSGKYHVRWIRFMTGRYGFTTPYQYITSWQLFGYVESAGWIPLASGGTPHARFVEVPLDLDVRMIQIRAQSPVHWIGIQELELFGEASPSIKGASGTAMGDFNGDNFADYADHHAPSGNFWVHHGNQNGTFSTANGATGRTGAGAAWRILTADFTGDGRADFADYHVASGNYWIHANRGDGTFSTSNWAWGSAVAAGANLEILAGDFTGDGRADFAERNLTTGQIRIRVNNGAGAETFPYLSSVSNFRSMFGPNWSVLVDDFNADGLADVAEYYHPGTFYVHRNLGSAGGFDFDQVPMAESDTSGRGAGWSVVVGDFTGDNRADYADVWRATGAFWIHRNKGDGTFDTANWGSGQTTRPDSAWRLLGESSF